MSDVFDRWISALVEEKPCEKEAKAAFEETKRILHGILMARGLWWYPPSFLGLVEYKGSWASSGEDALEELTANCFQKELLGKMEALALKYREEGSVEPLARCIIENYVTDQQRRADPIGYRTYIRLQHAIALCEESGIIEVSGGKLLPRNKNSAARWTVEEFLLQVEEEEFDHNEDAYARILGRVTECREPVPRSLLLDVLKKKARQGKVGYGEELDTEMSVASIIPCYDEYGEHEPAKDFQEQAITLIEKVKNKQKRERLLLLFKWLQDATKKDETVLQVDFARHIGLSPSRVTELFKDLRKVLAPLERGLK